MNRYMIKFLNFYNKVAHLQPYQENIDRGLHTIPVQRMNLDNPQEPPMFQYQDHL